MQPDVSSDEIARFVLFADQHKMDRSSAKAHDLKFISHSRALRRAAEDGATAMDVGADVTAATGIENPVLRYCLVSSLVMMTFGLIIPVYLLYKHATK